MRRLGIVVLVAYLVWTVLPHLFMQQPWPPKGKYIDDVEFVRIAGPGQRTGAVRLLGVWHLTGRARRLGGYSALVPVGPRSLLAQSDSIPNLMIHERPDGTFGHSFGVLPSMGEKYSNDVEAAARDPATGRIWYAFEQTNTIRRYAADGRLEAVHEPPDIDAFSPNGGVEAMARLADGRFILLQEAGPWSRPFSRTGLLYPGEPDAGAEPVRFSFKPPPGFDPSDAVALPDGRVLILVRTMRPGLGGLFSSRILVADPAQITPGKPWPWRELADLDKLAPRENYEGIAAVASGGGTTLWLISDSNHSAIVQRNLLVKLQWNECTAADAGECAGVRRLPRPSSARASPSARGR